MSTGSYQKALRHPVVQLADLSRHKPVFMYCNFRISKGRKTLILWIFTLTAVLVSITKTGSVFLFGLSPIYMRKETDTDFGAPGKQPNKKIEAPHLPNQLNKIYYTGNPGTIT